MAKKKWNHNWLYHDGNGKFRSKDVMVEDDYSEESGGREYGKIATKVRMPSDKADPKSLNGPVIIVQEGRKKGGE